MTKPEFLSRFAPVYEASPWVAEGVWPDPPDDLEGLATAMAAVVEAAPRDMKLALIRAHPELASRTKMADASVQEQAGAGLDQCSPAEFAAFQRLNGAYNARFGFPFIFAVKGATKQQILDSFVERVSNPPDDEFALAIEQICRIFAFRIEDRVLA